MRQFLIWTLSSINKTVGIGRKKNLRLLQNIQNIISSKDFRYYNLWFPAKQKVWIGVTKSFVIVSHFFSLILWNDRIFCFAKAEGKAKVFAHHLPTRWDLTTYWPWNLTCSMTPFLLGSSPEDECFASQRYPQTCHQWILHSVGTFYPK